MPGKVNPSIPEMVAMVCFQVLGNDSAVALAAQAGQLELNVMMPVIAYNLLMSIRILGNALRVLEEKCISGITVNKARCEWYAEHSVSLVTVLSPKIGYQRAAELAKRAIGTGKTIRQVMTESGEFTAEEANRLLEVRAMTEHSE